MATKIQDLPENNSPVNTWHTLVDDGAGNTYKVPLLDVPASALYQNTTVNFVNTESVADMQAKIDAVPKNLNGFDLIFQFGNGTYALGTGGLGLVFQYFGGPGRLIIQGNRSEANANDLHTTQDVVLSGANLGDDVLDVKNNGGLLIYVQNLRVDYDASANWKGIAFRYNSCYCDARYNYCLGDATTGSGAGVYFFRSGPSYAQENYVSQGRYGIQAADSTMLTSANNDDTGTTPDYGLQAQSSHVYKNGTQPTGGTANEFTSSGGQIT